MTDKDQNKYPTVRELTRADRTKLSELIKAFADRSGNVKLTEVIPRKPGDGEDKEKVDNADQLYDLIKSVMAGAIAWADAEVTEWFMELIDVNDRAAYEAMPFDIEIHIIDSLIAQKGFNNFFSRALALYKKIQG